MSDIAIKVEGLGKKYQIGDVKSGDFRNSFSNKINRLFRQTAATPKEEFWALKDVSFEIKKGEAVGIIGRNGAGKSTLLKLLSRITEPTLGRFEINGRVSSLLEVGTGFHPELTGRENVFLNGTILGMRRQEVNAKFDEIVAFSGVEKFIDTPVKHYSSGMKVRLAFAVAAHLEPETLIVDEVLAVGDAEFQEKCLGKMDEVSKQEGRTVVFVSHNMAAVKNLCQRGVLLKDGFVSKDGEIDNIVKDYIKLGVKNDFSQILDLTSLQRVNPPIDLIFGQISFDKQVYTTKDDLNISLSLKQTSNKTSLRDLKLSLHIVDVYGNQIYHLNNGFIGKVGIEHQNKNLYEFHLKQNRLKAGDYDVQLWMSVNGIVQDFIFGQIKLTIQEGNIYNYSRGKMILGVVQPEFSFEVIEPSI
ncbi:ABC transporter ATP-binding protein [Xanthovirga aplysinae]|uniref:ABC transporter ATP-binding protein n=1 Tax=Xanthovirga aplysinae TaxID=2529853 RepID=UPI0012BC557B|nr:ABC transporter ATP-binding protein [Xanthovirga aplysinae]MTI32490.1 ABC transporter ATP-binding protein [Xanthovirga aplysinae]